MFSEWLGECYVFAMVDHKATIRWAADDGDFRRRQYSRAHTWTFDGGLTVPASSSPSVVRVPYSDPGAVDPEEAFVAALASCHMMTFLDLASRAGFVITRYEDDAIGRMTKNEQGVPWVSTTVLSPRITYAGTPPSEDEEDALHHRAHEQCFIAQSVKTDVQTVPTRTRRSAS